jgi:hypothetical protein
MTYLRAYVTGTKDVILSEVGRTTAVSLLGAHQRPGVASRHSFGTPLIAPGTVNLWVWTGG